MIVSYRTFIERRYDMNFENEAIKHIDTGSLEYIQFKKLLTHNNVKHAYVLSSYDMNFRAGKDFCNIDRVNDRLQVVCDNFGFKPNTIIRPDFEHTSNVARIDEMITSDDNPNLRGEGFLDVDGLVTNKKDITLMATNADCLLIMLYDPTKNVIGNIHSGWKGTIGKIIVNAINKMKEEYGCNPNDIEAYLSPSIRKCHFEVEEDVKELFYETFKYTNRIDEIIEKGEVKEGKQKYLVDNVLANVIMLEESGVKSEKIIDSKICSICSCEKIHSCRVEGPLFGLRSCIYKFIILFIISLKNISKYDII